MDVIKILSELVLAAEKAWVNAPEGDRKETMRELSDALRETAEARMQARQPKGSSPVRALVVHLTEGHKSSE